MIRPIAWLNAAFIPSACHELDIIRQWGYSFDYSGMRGTLHGEQRAANRETMRTTTTRNHGTALCSFDTTEVLA